MNDKKSVEAGKELSVATAESPRPALARLVIDRERWLRGTGSGTLLNGEGKMCCLGFECRRRGLDPSTILLQCDPHGLVQNDRENNDLIRDLGNLLSSTDPYVTNSEPVGALIDINDTRGMSDSDREREIAELFLALGVQVEFVDTRPNSAGRGDNNPTEEKSGVSR